jgi:hypothetical protein
MEKAGKRLDRPTYWELVVPLVFGHVILSSLLVPGSATGLGSVDTIVLGAVDTIVLGWLARTLARRFRDIGWPAWIGPTILLITMVVPPLVIVGIAIASHAGAKVMGWWSLYGLLFGPLNFALLVVAGSLPGTPAIRTTEIAEVFE